MTFRKHRLAGRRFPPQDLLVLAGYFILTILFTWPLALHLTDGIPGDGFDGWQNYWNLWWVKESLLTLETNPFFSTYLYPPDGTNLFFHTLNIFNGLWTLPIQLNFGLAVSYNSVVFASFVLAGYGGYLLSLYSLTRLKVGEYKWLRPAAFVGGLVFTMSPFHFSHLLGHMQVFSMIWPPFYVLSLLLTLQPWRSYNKATSYNIHNIALSSFFLILATLVDWYHTLYLLIFTTLLLLWMLLTRAYQQKREVQDFIHPIVSTLAIGLGFGLIFAPLLLPMIREAKARPDLQTGLSQNITLSADLLAFITPSEMHPLWGQWAKAIADNFSTTSSERMVFAGFLPILLGLFIVISRRNSPVIRFWVATLALFFILAIGPYLHILGKIVSINGWLVPMPYFALYKSIPFIGLTRSLSRYDLMVMLALSVLVSAAIAHLQAKRKTAPYWISIVAVAIISFEFLPVPYPISKIDIPQFYFDIAAQTDSYTIAELPMNWDRPTPLLHQTIHKKPLLTAYTSRNHPKDLSKRIPVFQQWRYLGTDIIDQPLEIIAPTIFYDFNLRYIVLDYWQMPPGFEREATEKWVFAALPGALPVYDDGRLKVYQSPPKTETETYLSLGDGWGERQEDENGLPTRILSGKAELFIHHPQNRPLTLEINDKNDKGVSLTIYANGELVGKFQTEANINLPALSDELVKLRIEGEEIIVKRIAITAADK